MTLTDPSRRKRHPVGWLAISALMVLVLAGSGSTGAPAASTVLPPGALAPTERQRLLARRIGTILEQAHYRRATIDDAMSAEVYQRYLESLDSQRSYLLASDVAELPPLPEVAPRELKPNVLTPVHSHG